VVLLVIFAQIVSKFVLKNLGIKLMPLEKDEPGFEEQVKKLSDQVKLVSIPHP